MLKRRVLLDGGDAGAAAVGAVERGGSVPENGLLNRNALGIADEGVGRNDAVLVGVLVRMIGRRVGDPHHRFFLLLPHFRFVQAF